MHNSLCSLVHSACISISSSGLHQRFNQESVEFLKGELCRLVAKNIQVSEKLKGELSKRFKRIIIGDSCSWQVKPELESEFKGCGGDGSAAGIKVQFFFNLLTSAFSCFDIKQGSESDQGYADNIPKYLKRGDLALFDLGYFKLLVLQKLITLGAFFVSRYLHGTDVFIKSGDEFKKLDLIKLLSKLKTNSAFDFTVYLGSKHKVPVRFVAVRLPQAVINQRLRKLREKAKKKGRTLSKREQVLAQWNMFVTNTTSDLLSASEITQIYRLRWSVELLFKQFKSTLKIHESNHGNKFRIQCEIIGSLIVAAIIMSFHGLAQALLWKKHQQEISFEKLFKFFKNNSYSLFHLPQLSASKLKGFFTQLFFQVFQQCKKETRKSRPSSIASVFIPIQKLKVTKLTQSYLRNFSC